MSDGEVTDNIVAMALPVIAHKRVCGAINVVFFRHSFRMEKALRCLDPLKRCVKKVEEAFERSHQMNDRAGLVRALSLDSPKN